MKTAREWLEDARQGRQFEDTLKGYDIYEGELEELTGGFWFNMLDGMNMAGLERNEYEVLEAFIVSDSIADAAAKCGCSTVWYNTLLKRALAKVDEMLAVTTKYAPFRGTE